MIQDLTPLGEAAIRRAVGPREAVAAIREAFRADGEGRVVVPAVINLAIPGVHGEFHVKTAYIEGVPHVAVKVASGFYDNPRRGLPSGSGLIALFDASTGLPVALLLDNGYLTDLRTGAAGAVAADCLALRDIVTVGVVGTGVQARHQVACLLEVRRFRRLLAWGRDASRAEEYCEEMRTRHGLDAQAADLETVARDADILVTATPSREPLVRAEWLRPGQHVTAVGADAPGKQELDPACLARADRVVADRLTQCAAFGELQHVVDAGLLPAGGVQIERSGAGRRGPRERSEIASGVQGAPRVNDELGEIVAGRKPGRLRDDEITIADLTGVGFQDTAIASLAYERLHC